MTEQIRRVEETAKTVALALDFILEKSMLVSFSRKHFVCHLANIKRTERN